MKIPYSCFDVYFLRGVSDTRKLPTKDWNTQEQVWHCMAIMGMRCVDIVRSHVLSIVL